MVFDCEIGKSYFSLAEVSSNIIANTRFVVSRRLIGIVVIAYHDCMSVCVKNLEFASCCSSIPSASQSAVLGS